MLMRRLAPGKIGFLTWGRRGRRRVTQEAIILEESPQVGGGGGHSINPH
jgi:hypothetical protein